MSVSDVSPRRARLRLFGTFRLTGVNGDVVSIVSRRARGLLAYLALAPDHTGTRERLCGLLWSDRGEPQARSSLRQCLFDLRETFLAADLDIIDSGREIVTLKSDTYDSDVDNVNRALAGNDIAVLIAALGAISSERLLDDLDIGGLYGDWLDQTRAALDRSIGSRVLLQLERLEAARDWRSASEMAEAFLRRDPLDETVVAATIRADVAAGNANAARRKFQVLQKSLAREFGAQPGTMAREAFSAISTPVPKAISPRPEANRAFGAPPLVVVAAFECPEGPSLVAAVRDEVLSGLACFHDMRVVNDQRPVDIVAADQSNGRGQGYILGASLRTVREGPRLVVQLLRSHDRHIIWSSTFAMAGLETIGTIDDVVAQTVGAILPSIDTDRMRRSAESTIEPGYESRLIPHFPTVKPKTFEEARAAADALETMISANPSFSPPYLSLAYLYNTDFGYTRAGSSGPVEHARALHLAKSAMALDRGHVHGYTVTGWCYLRRREFRSAKNLFEQALTLNPFHARRVMEVGWGYVFLGDLDAAQALFDRCLLLYPSPADGFFMDLGLLAVIRGDRDLAASYFNMTADPEIWVSIYRAINADLGGLGDGDDCQIACDRVRSIWPGARPPTGEAVVAWFAGHHPFQSADVSARLVEASRRVFRSI